MLHDDLGVHKDDNYQLSKIKTIETLMLHNAGIGVSACQSGGNPIGCGPTAMKESFKQRAYRILSAKILGGELRPGDELDRRSMAAQLGMSVAPVLEAMLLLTEEGLLETRPRSGTRVARPRQEDVLGRHWLREALECQVARLVFGEPIRCHWDTLLPLARAVDVAVANNDVRWRAEVEFHGALASLVGSDAFVSVFRKTVRASLFYEIKVLGTATNGPASSHVRLLERLRDASAPDEAEAIIRDDLRTGKDALFAATLAR